MNKRNRSYYSINIIVLLITFIYLAYLCYNNLFYLNINENLMNRIWIIIIFILFYIAIHSIKMIRFYLIIMKKNIHFIRFIKLYIKTTFVNIIIPFKTGELFRAYCYGYNFNDYKEGIICVIVERFIDILVLIMLLIPMDLYFFGMFSNLSIILLFCIIILTILYGIFPAFYRNMNKFSLLNLKGKLSLKILNILEEINDWRNEIKSLLAGRSIIIIILSFIAWILEYLMFKFIFTFLNINFSMQHFSKYLNTILNNSDNKITDIYTVSGSFLLGIIIIIIYLMFTKEKKREK